MNTQVYDTTKKIEEDHYLVDPRWIYYKVIVGEYFHVYDHLIVNVLPLIKKRVAYEKWFYLRMVDEEGLQLRVRFLAKSMADKPVMARKIEEILQGAVYEFSILPESTYTPMVGGTIESPMEGIKFPAPFLKLAEYEPEFDKYGSGDFLANVESHFMDSSEIAEKIIRNEMFEERSRKWIACSLLKVVAGLVVDHRPWQEFLNDYTEFWAYSIPNGDAFLSNFDQNIEKLKGESYNPLDTDNLTDSEREVLTLWAKSLSKVLSLNKKYISDSKNFRDNLLFNLSHLIFNRLGFSAIEESYLARVTESYYGSQL
jgi:hypothetical protein